MFLPIDPSSGLPVYRQIMDQVRRMIVAGRLQVGERLPSIRELATSLGLNPLTVGKAYGELERTHVIEMRRGLGMFVRAASAPRPHGEVVPAGVQQAADRLVLEAAQAGLTRARTVAAVEEAWRELGGRELGKERKHR
ncbi:MAG: transcriptional regulator, GntR family [Myxococcales bacterium]|nr:transcriptional regulator, GntR family [Myxococcales bacterium]